MSISGFNPTAALPTLATGGMLASSNPLVAAPAGSGLVGSSSLLGAQAGVTEKPGILTRFSNAMRAAIGELRGGTPAAPIQTQQLALSMPSAPVAVAKPAAAPKKGLKGKTFTDPQGNLRQVGTGKVLKPATPTAAAAAAPTMSAGMAQPQLEQQPQLPSNAAQVPGATVYSYDQNGNPVAPTMQQLGMTPTMLQGLEGMTGTANPDGPQVNATNQTNVGTGTGPGLGLGLGLGLGAAVPVLGQPIAVAPAAPAAPAAVGGTGSGTQAVTNSNVTDVASRNEGIGGYGSGYGSGFGSGYGSGYGGSPWDGIATPAAPYGPSMTGAFVLGDRSRLA